jgi:hypothetical protein
MVGPSSSESYFDHRRSRASFRSARQPRSGRTAKRIGIAAAKLAVAAMVGYALYAAAQFTERRNVSSWSSTTQLERATKPVPEARTSSSSLRSEQRGVVSASGCAGQTWPNISSECITGRAEPLRHDVRPVEGDTTSSTLLRPTGFPRSEFADPADTGALPSVVYTPTPSDTARKLTASSAPREKRRAIKSRSHASVARPVSEARRGAEPPRKVVQARTDPPRPPNTLSRAPIQFSLAERGNN